jgi:DNA-binding MarR family transcriptional regulator
MATGEELERAADADVHVSYVVARLERAVRQAITERVRPHGLTTLQYTTLSVLGRRDGLSNAQLARRSYMTPQSMSEVIEALERSGLIARERHPNHRRVYPATLTPKGRRVLAACEEAVGAMEEEMMGALSAAERAALVATLKTCVRSLRAGFPDEPPLASAPRLEAVSDRRPART